MKKLVLIAAVASLALAGCTSPDPCLEAEDVAECQAWSDAGGDVSDYLLYGMAGYMIGSSMSGGSKQTYIYRDPSYRGTYRTLRTPIGTKDQQIRKLEKKVAAQKAELKRQQAANAKKKATRSSSRSFGSRSFSGGRRR